MFPKISFPIASVLALLALLTAACGPQIEPKEAIIGQWEGQFQGAATQIEFTPTGMLVITATVENISTLGIYTFSDEDTLQMTLPELGIEEVPGTVEVKSDTLTIRDPLGEISGTFTRLKK